MRIDLMSCGFGDLHHRNLLGADKIIIDGNPVRIAGRRGLCIAIIDHTNGKPKFAACFDTHDNVVGVGENIRQNTRPKDILAIIVIDEASRALTNELKAQLERLGSTEIRRLGFKEPWLFCCQILEDVSSGRKLAEKIGAQDSTVTDSCNIELPAEADARLRAEAEARAAQERVQNALAAQQQAEERARAAEEAHVNLIATQRITQKRTVMERQQNSLSVAIAAANASLELLRDFKGAADPQITALTNSLRGIQQRIN